MVNRNKGRRGRRALRHGKRHKRLKSESKIRMPGLLADLIKAGGLANMQYVMHIRIYYVSFELNITSILGYLGSALSTSTSGACSQADGCARDAHPSS